MKTITLRLDVYSKIILTVIAISLFLIALKPFLPENLQATPQVIDVNIASIYGETYPYMTYGELPIRGSVEIDGEVDVNVTNRSLYVYDLNK